MHARGIITGITRGTNRAHIVRAALESIAYQSADLLACMESDMGLTIPSLKVDGGASLNGLLMQHQADVLGIPVVRGNIVETTALGAAFLAGLATGFWSGMDEVRQIWREDKTYQSTWTSEQREQKMRDWHAAVDRSRSRNR